MTVSFTGCSSQPSPFDTPAVQNSKCSAVEPRKGESLTKAGCSRFATTGATWWLFQLLQDAPSAQDSSLRLFVEERLVILACCRVKLFLTVLWDEAGSRSFHIPKLNLNALKWLKCIVICLQRLRNRATCCYQCSQAINDSPEWPVLVVHLAK